MSDNPKIDPEKLKQLQQLMAMQMQQGQGQHGGKNVQGGFYKKLSKFTPKNMFIAMIHGMQASVKFVDQFINFIINRKTEESNNVVVSARSPILFGTYTIIIFVIFGFLWASTAPLDSAETALGTVISHSQRKSLNHQEGGVIKALYVNVGDFVKKGDKLLEFDSSRIKNEYEIVLNQYRSLMAAEARLLAEINDNPEVEYPEFLTKDKSESEVAKIIETQNSLFNSKKDLKKAEHDSLIQKINQTKKQIEGLEAKKISAIKTFEFYKDRARAAKALTAQGFGQKAALLELEVREANAQSDIAQTDTQIVQSDQEIIRTNIELLNLENKFVTNNLTELKDTQNSLSERREKFYQISDVLDRSILRSPVDGIVNNINFYTIGSTVPPSHPIMEISPTDDHLVIEVKVPPKNISSIHVGLKSKIRFSAFKSRTTPTFTGTLTSISPDIVIDQRQPMDQSVAGGYYLGRVEIDMDEFNEIAKTRKLELQPGMQAEVNIITGTRTLLRYLLDPVFDAMFKGFKEK